MLLSILSCIALIYAGVSFPFPTSTKAKLMAPKYGLLLPFPLTGGRDLPTLSCQEPKDLKLQGLTAAYLMPRVAVRLLGYMQAMLMDYAGLWQLVMETDADLLPLAQP